jgi:hypothetical protein
MRSPLRELEVVIRQIWRYIEAQHEELGVGLFIVPILLLVFAVAGQTQLVYAIVN